MRVGIDIQGSVSVGKEIDGIPTLADRNMINAAVICAVDARNLLRDATKGPKSGRVAREAAEAWTVVPEPTGASVINTNIIAAYLEFGVGIYNEGPGLKGPIKPRFAKVLRWVDDQGNVHFARSVKGFKGVAMVRSNWENLKQLAKAHAEDAAAHTAQGIVYG